MYSKPSLFWYLLTTEVEVFAKKNPKQVLRRLESFLSEQKSGGTALAMETCSQNPSPSMGRRSPRLDPSSNGKELNFTGVCELPPEMEGEARLIWGFRYTRRIKLNSSSV